MISKSTLFNDLILSWLLDVKSTRALSTYVKYEQLSRNYILPYFKGIVLGQISQSNLDDFRLHLAEVYLQGYTEGKSLSAGNIKCLFMIINQSLQSAYDARILHFPIFISCKIGKRKNLVKVFSHSEQMRLESQLKKEGTLSALGIYLCLYTGVRLGELCALRWSDINLAEHYFYIQRTIQRLPSEKPDKKTELTTSVPKSTSSIRLIPIPDFLLRHLREISLKYAENTFILTGTLKPMEPRTLQYQYKKYVEESKIKYLNFHSLRHTFATRCIMAGMDPKTLSEILGHSDIKITLEYYFHSSFEFKKKQMNLLNALS